MMKNIFTDHPKSIGETYAQHFKFALVFGFKMIVGGLACLAHAIFPFVFKTTGSNMLLKMTQDFVERTPKTEKRVIALSKKIEKKMRKNVS